MRKRGLVLDKVKNHRADKINMITEKIKRWRHLSLCFIVSTLRSCVAGWLAGWRHQVPNEVDTGYVQKLSTSRGHPWLNPCDCACHCSWMFKLTQFPLEVEVATLHSMMACTFSVSQRSSFFKPFRQIVVFISNSWLFCHS